MNQITPTMLDALESTRPWVKFLSVLGFVMVGLMVLAALGVGGFGAYRLVAHDGGADAWLLVGLGILYLAAAVLYVFPCQYLSGYAGAIRDSLDAQEKTPALERALRLQKSFWKFAGIVTLVGLVLYVPAVIAAIAIPNYLTAKERSRQLYTMQYIRQIGVALDGYADQENAYPNVTTIDELAALLEPTHIRELPRRDGWGTPFAYQATDCESGACQSYAIASAGRDRIFERARPADWGNESNNNRTFDQDIVYTAGTWLRAMYPEHDD